MLFILSGGIQIGKSRALVALCRAMQKAGNYVYGVIAPGNWTQHEDGSFEKLGIENILLPQNEVIQFALRRDIAKKSGTFHTQSPSTSAQLGWDISESALERVNAHFAAVPTQAAPCGAEKSLLVADEFGWLELKRGEGLKEAVRVFKEGPTTAFSHGLCVVRPELIERALTQFSAWGNPVVLSHADAFESLEAVYVQLGIVPEEKNSAN